MPIFDFICKECAKYFDADKNKVKCPDCGSGNIKQLLSPFSSSSRSITSMRPGDVCRSCRLGENSR